jgi:predicted lipase
MVAGVQAQIFAAKLLFEQAKTTSDRLASLASSVDKRLQIKLYTLAGPKAGDATFVSYLEAGMLERFNIFNRYDIVPTGPPYSMYSSFRPKIW